MNIRYIVVHCSDTPNGRWHDAADINNWHTWPRENTDTGLWFYAGEWHEYSDLPDDVRGKRGNGWDSIGYHWVILLDGTVETGRPLGTPGAHVRGYNDESIGICLIGRDEYTDAQLRSLEGLLIAMKSNHRNADVVGHYDLDPHKTCPNKNILEFWSDVKKRGTSL